MATIQTSFAKSRANSLISRLLYGANVDRNAKARARVGLAILAFALVYGAIAAKLVYFGVMSDGSANKRFTPQDAVATARPDIVDRNGEILATACRDAQAAGFIQANEPNRRAQSAPSAIDASRRFGSP